MSCLLDRNHKVSNFIAIGFEDVTPGCYYCESRGHDLISFVQFSTKEDVIL